MGRANACYCAPMSAEFSTSIPRPSFTDKLDAPPSLLSCRPAHFHDLPSLLLLSLASSETRGHDVDRPCDVSSNSDDVQGRVAFISTVRNALCHVGSCYTAAGVSLTAKVKRPLYLEEVNQLALKVDRDRALYCRSV